MIRAQGSHWGSDPSRAELIFLFFYLSPTQKRIFFSPSSSLVVIIIPVSLSDLSLPSSVCVCIFARIGPRSKETDQALKENEEGPSLGNNPLLWLILLLKGGDELFSAAVERNKKNIEKRKEGSVRLSSSSLSSSVDWTTKGKESLDGLIGPFFYVPHPLVVVGTQWTVPGSDVYTTRVAWMYWSAFFVLFQSQESHLSLSLSFSCVNHRCNIILVFLFGYSCRERECVFLYISFELASSRTAS